MKRYFIAMLFITSILLIATLTLGCLNSRSETTTITQSDNESKIHELQQRIDQLTYEKNVFKLTLEAYEYYAPDAINSLPQTLPDDFSPLQKEIKEYLNKEE